MGEKGKGGNCQQENVVYRIICSECGKSGTKAEYTGETSRTAYLRGREHLDGLEKENGKNALWKHCATVQSGAKVEFRMKVIRSHKSPMTRQVHESIEIEHSKANIIMNSKGEWNGSRIPRVVVEVADEVQDEEGEEQRTFKNKKIDKNRNTNENGKWNMENLKKRKRDQDETEEKAKRIKENVESECGPAEPVYMEPKDQHYDKDMVDQP